MAYSQVRSDERPSKSLVGPPGVQIDVLHDFFGVVDRAEHAVAVGDQLAPIRLGQTCEVLAAAISDGAHEDSVPRRCRAMAIG
jgi:hypothetical protein